MTMHLRLLRKEEAGGVATEFALIGALIAVLVPAFIDIANLIDTRMQMSGALRAGYQYAIHRPDDTQGIANAIRGGSSLSSDRLQTSSSQSCECDNVGSLCGRTCDSGRSPAKYVTLSANYTMSTNYNYGSLLGGMNSVNQSITVRVQ